MLQKYLVKFKVLKSGFHVLYLAPYHAYVSNKITGTINDQIANKSPHTSQDLRLQPSDF